MGRISPIWGGKIRFSLPDHFGTPWYTGRSVCVTEKGRGVSARKEKEKKERVSSRMRGAGPGPEAGGRRSMRRTRSRKKEDRRKMRGMKVRPRKRAGRRRSGSLHKRGRNHRDGRRMNRPEWPRGGCPPEERTRRGDHSGQAHHYGMRSGRNP